MQGAEKKCVQEFDGIKQTEAQYKNGILKK
jgi:hypothetical protein